MSKKKTKEQFIEEANIVHKHKYDYSLVIYKDNKTKVSIICMEHGIFEQTPYNHIHFKQNCPHCVGGIRLSKDQFTIKSNKIHNFKYDYSLVDYKNARTKVKIICPIHGIFEQVPQHHMRGVGCPMCSESKGERIIAKFLDDLKIKYKREKVFKNCRYKYPLPFDFYLFDLNICIEYDGMQHFRAWNRIGGANALEKQIIKDSIKDQYCKNKNIKLIRIKYNDNIFEKLEFIKNPR